MAKLWTMTLAFAARWFHVRLNDGTTRPGLGSGGVPRLGVSPMVVLICGSFGPACVRVIAGPVWTAAQPAAAVVFLVAGALIKVRRP